MNSNKKCYINLLPLLLALLIISTFSGCGENYMSPEVALRNFSNRIEQDNLNGMTLTIYYMNSISTIHFPFNTEAFVAQGIYDAKKIVDEHELRKHIELLRQINADDLVPVSHELPMLVMLYYVFEVNGRTIFGFVPQAAGNDSSMYINGVEFEWIDSFFDVIRPFIPEEEVRRWDASLRSDKAMDGSVS